MRIVDEFYDVEIVVVAFKKVRLRSATHLANHAAGVKRHPWGNLRNIMPDEKDTPRPGMSKDEVALDLMKFISTTTGVGKTAAGAGFAAKATKTPEEQVTAMLDLFKQCRKVVNE